MIPQTYEEWRYCIIHDCKINLTKEFATIRLNVYKNADDPETIKFRQLYGDMHLNSVIFWLKKVA